MLTQESKNDGKSEKKPRKKEKISQPDKKKGGSKAAKAASKSKKVPVKETLLAEVDFSRKYGRCD